MSQILEIIIYHFSMNTRVFDKEKYSLEELVEAVQLGCDLGGESSGDHVPTDIIKDWLSTTVKRTAEEWQNLSPEIKVIDHAGWEKKNFKKRWYEELITYQQYIERRDKSVCYYEK